MKGVSACAWLEVLRLQLPVVAEGSVYGDCSVS